MTNSPLFIELVGFKVQNLFLEFYCYQNLYDRFSSCHMTEIKLSNYNFKFTAVSILGKPGQNLHLEFYCPRTKASCVNIRTAE